MHTEWKTEEVRKFEGCSLNEAWSEEGSNFETPHAGLKFDPICIMTMRSFLSQQRALQQINRAKRNCDGIFDHHLHVYVTCTNTLWTMCTCDRVSSRHFHKLLASLWDAFQSPGRSRVSISKRIDSWLKPFWSDWILLPAEGNLSTSSVTQAYASTRLRGDEMEELFVCMTILSSHFQNPTPSSALQRGSL